MGILYRAVFGLVLFQTSLLVAWDAMPLRSMYHEPGAVLRSAYLISRFGWGAFSYRGCNPVSLEDFSSEAPILICLQGDHSNPATFVPLIDSLRNSPTTCHLPVFVPNCAYQRCRPPAEELRMLLSQIRDARGDAAPPAHIILIGHSMGGLSSCYYTYLEEAIPGIRVTGVIAISAPLCSTQCSEADLVDIVQEVEHGRKCSACTAPLYVVFGDQDWLLARESLDVASAEKTYICPRQGHLSALYDENAIAFVQRSVETLVQSASGDSAPSSESGAGFLK